MRGGRDRSLLHPAQAGGKFKGKAWGVGGTSLWGGMKLREGPWDSVRAWAPRGEPEGGGVREKHPKVVQGRGEGQPHLYKEPRDFKNPRVALGRAAVTKSQEQQFYTLKQN